MAYPAENLDFEDPSKEQLNQLQNQESDTATLNDINNKRTEIRDKIDFAKGKREISSLDAENWKRELQRTDRSKKDVSMLDNKITGLIAESRQLMSVIDDKEELALFQEMSLEEKRTYVAGLRGQAANLNAWADKLSAMMSVGNIPAGAKDKLKALAGPERAKYIKELIIWREDVGKYAGLLSRYEKHFGGDTLNEFIEQFKDRSGSGRKEWIEKFVDKEGKPRERLTQRYEALPAEYRGRIKDFYNMRRHEKVAEVGEGDKIGKVQEEYDFDNEFEAEIGWQKGASYMSDSDRKSAKEAFRIAPASMRKEMKTKIKDFIGAEAKLGTRYEKLDAQARTDIQSGHGDFKNLSFDKKEKALEEVEGEGGRLNREYKEKLLKEKENKVISEGTFKEYMDWFKNPDRDLAEKRLAIKGEVFNWQEMAPRRQLKQRFETELPSEVQAANKHFYDLPGHERRDLFEKLRSEQEQKRLAEKGGKADAAETKPPVKEGIGVVTGDEKIIKGADAENDNALDEAKIRDEIKRVKEGSPTLKDKIRNKNIGEGLVDLAVKSDLFNQGVHVSERKDKHLQNEKERRINKKFVLHTGGKMVADTGHNKARKVKEVDLRKMDGGVMTEDQILKFKNVVTDHRGEKAQNVFDTQIVDQASGQKLSGVMGKEQVKKQEKDLKKDMEERVVVSLDEHRRGISKKNREKVQAEIEKDKLKVELKAA